MTAEVTFAAIAQLVASRGNLSLEDVLAIAASPFPIETFDYGDATHYGKPIADLDTAYLESALAGVSGLDYDTRMCVQAELAKRIEAQSSSKVIRLYPVPGQGLPEDDFVELDESEIPDLSGLPYGEVLEDFNVVDACFEGRV